MSSTTMLLSEVAIMASGGTPNRRNKDYWNGDIPWVTTAEVSQYQYILDTKEKITENGLKNSSAKLFPEGSILLALYGQGKTRGKVALLGIPATTNQACLAIQPDNTLLKTKYLYYFLENSYKRLRKMANSGGQDNLSMSILKEFPISFPVLSTQEYRVNLFDKLSMKIQLQQEKIDLLKEQKKGFMQKIFSQELRFKDEDGKEFPEWELTSIKEIATSISYGMNAAAKPFDNKNIYIRITDIDDESRKFLDHNKVSPDGTLDDKFLLDNGDILFARTGASVGKSYYYKKDNRPFYFAGFLIRVRLIKNINSHFIYQQTLTTMYLKWVKLMSMRSGQPGINAEEYGQFEVLLPCKKEQDKISSFLYSLDKKIESMNKKTYELELQKQAFMQQMFI